MAQFTAHGALLETMSMRGIVLKKIGDTGSVVSTCQWLEIASDNDNNGKENNKSVFFFDYLQDLESFCQKHNIEIEVDND